MLPPNGNYAFICGGTVEKLLVPLLLTKLNRTVVVYGDAPRYLPRPYTLEDSKTAEIRLNTTVICYGVKPSMDLLRNPLVSCVYVLEYPWLLFDAEKYSRIFVTPGILPLQQRSAIFSALFRHVMSYDRFVTFTKPRTVVSIGNPRVPFQTADITEETTAEIFD